MRPHEQPILERPIGALLASLFPTAAFIAAVAITDVWVDFRSVSLRSLLAAVPFYLVAVSVPSLLPISATKSSAARVTVTAAMCVVAACAGVLAIRTDDAQAGFAVFYVPYVAVPGGLVLWIGRSVAERRRRVARRDGDHVQPAQLSHRVSALLLDVAVLATVLFVPVTGLSDAKREVLAGVVAVGVATIYVAGFTAWRSATPGQLALRLRVVDADSLGPISAGRAVLRSLIVVLEVGTAPTLILAPVAIAELVVAGSSGRSITDRLIRTRVVTAS